MSEMPLKEEVLTKQYRIAKNAKTLPHVSFTAISYHMNERWLEEAYNNTKKDKASGIDGITKEDYQKNLHANLNDLLDRAKSGKYYAPPVKRVYVPKGKGKEKRPLGIPTFEDKVLQRAIKMLIEPIFEQDFYDFSYGFRPEKSQHQALQELRMKAMNTNGWIIDLDIRKYFDSINHSMLREIYKRRVCDGVITRLLGKWLKAGIMEDESLHYENEGTPQGGVISPLLSNIFLHEILDKWYAEEVKPRLRGNSFLIRFADDAVMGFSNKGDALKVMKVLYKRLEKYDLTLHPQKTKLIKFQNPNNSKYQMDKEENGTFDFLGFTFYWGKSRKGRPTLRWKTSTKKFSISLRNIKEWCKKNRHTKVRLIIYDLNRKLKGYYGYYGIIMNYRSISTFYYKVKCLLYKWLNRRNRNKGISYGRFDAILKTFPLAKPRIVHRFT
jgi:group II intron reverse transcriptase/maturase